MKIIPIYYHLVSNERNPLVENLYSHKNIATFGQDLEVLVRKYKILDLADIQANRRGVVLTFDDGLSECYHTIYPLLEKYSLPAFFFVNNDFIDNKAMFYRAKVSLLISKLAYLSPIILQHMSYMLDCKITSIKEKLLSLKSSDDHSINSLLTIAGIDSDLYLQEKSPYLSSPQISEMIKAGYYFGGHTRDHLRLKDMPASEQEYRIVDSALDISKRFNLDYSLGSIPHNDVGISRDVLKKVSQQIDFLFGGYGLNHQLDIRYIQRISNEHSSLRIDRFINSWKIFHYVSRNVRFLQKKS